MRAQASVLSRSLALASELVAGGERRSDAVVKAMTSLIAAQPAAVIDYISLADSSTLQELTVLSPGHQVLVSLAVRFGATRLIDNALLTP
jgi:pantoate--beta-alanine ligase